GKDPTKVDRSGAYIARKIAVDYLKKYKAREVRTKLAYAIGIPGPVMATATIDGVDVDLLPNSYVLRANGSAIGYDITPAGIARFLDLKHPIYAETSRWGHFGHKAFPWG
ncbi:MAG: methionine adenosyltransferase domain-containing protein, partial [Sedimentisphaerales bacterium]|nr:methionine adenosyltransferase domain-containing protein [Sedimentisphaerales bacterium]